MVFKKKILSNGLVIVGELNNSAKSAAIGFFVRTGARDENKQISGVSHFLEHMVFKGTDKLSALEVNQAFDCTGAQFNAFTSEESTVFYAAVLPEYLLEITDLWSQLMRPALRDTDFDIEKNVIKEEIAMYNDMPSFDVVDKCRSLHFGSHLCGNSVLGSVESIDNLTAEQTRNYFAARYAPNNMVVAVVGNFNWEKICTAIENKCGNWSRQDVSRRIEDHDAGRGKGKLEKDNLNREHICLISKAVSAQDKRRFAASVLTAIVGDSVGSRFYWQLIDKALAETATMQFAPMDGTGIFYNYFQCSTDKAAKVLDIVGAIFANLTEKGVTEDELRTARNKILSALVIKNEITSGRLNDVGFSWLYLQKYLTVEDDIRAIKAVTADDIHSLAKEFDPAEFTQFSIGPA